MAFTKMITLLLILGTIGGLNAHSRIVGGVDTQTRYTFAVSIQDAAHKHICGGAILDSRWILTSAKCVHSASTPVVENLIVGTSSLDPVGGTLGTLYTIEKKIPHPNFDPANTKLIYNIGMIKTRQIIVFTTNVRPISIYTFPVANGINVVQVGWGASVVTPTPTASNVILAMNVTLEPADECRQFGIEDITSYEFCGLRAGKGACDFDTGNPLVYNGNYLYGLVINDKNCATTPLDRYIIVYSFNNWINDVKNANP